MGKYEILLTCRDDKTWYKKGDVVELPEEKAAVLMKKTKLSLTTKELTSKLETASDKKPIETATKPSGKESGK